jgi:hypothetical protein
VNGALKYTDTAYIMYLATLVKCIERAKAFEKQDFSEFGGVRVAHLFSFLCCVVSVSLFVNVRLHKQRITNGVPRDIVNIRNTRHRTNINKESEWSTQGHC